MRLIEIRGVPIKQKNTDIAQIITPKAKVYTEIPEIYIDNNTWPKYCNINCYNCTCEIASVPFFIPKSIIGEKIYKCNGPVFCSPNCATCEIDKIKDMNTRDLKREYLKILFYRITGKMIDIFNPAKDKLELDEYGGSKSKQEYQQELKSNNALIFSLIRNIITK